MIDTPVELREITPENVAAVVGLKIKPEQDGLVAINANSLAEAYAYGDRAWPRAIYADDTPVGFLMLDLVPAGQGFTQKSRPEYWLWRLMVDAEHQGRGCGRAAVRAAVAFVETQPDADALLTSYVPRDGCAEGFYRGLGFVPTGEVDDGEVVLRLELGDNERVKPK